MATRRESALADVRYVAPDTLRQGDLESTRVGRVHFIQSWNNAIEFRTKDDWVLFTAYGDDTRDPVSCRVTLLERKHTEQPALF